MSVANELTRIKGAKNDLKASINAKTDSEHQITNETIDEYADFVDSITSGGGGIDWSAIGYSGTPQSIIDGYNYALQIKNNWDATQTSLRNMFHNDNQLVYLPLIDTSNITDTRNAFDNAILLQKIPLINTSNATNMGNMFKNATSLAEIPILNISKATNLGSMFSGCYYMTDTSLDNILQMCIGATSYTSTKTLANMGMTSTYYPASRIQALPHYQDFINAGWTIGY